LDHISAEGPGGLSKSLNDKRSAPSTDETRLISSAKAGRIRGFDGLRAIAFLLVFASHKIYFAHADSFGDVGVWLFFVLSGFLITRILAQLRSDIEDGFATTLACLNRFYRRRTARIFPPYYLLLAFVTLASYFVAIDYFGPLEKLVYLLYGTNFFVAARGQWIGDFGHLWSLAVEEQFYLAFAPLILLLPRRHSTNISISVVLLGVMTKIALELYGASAVSINVNSLVNFALIGVGGVVGLNANRLAPKWVTSGAAQGASLLLFVAVPTAFGTWLHIWPLLGQLNSILAGILLFQIFNGQRSWLVAILESAPLRSLGRISYGAYLVHPLLHFGALDSLLPSAALGSTPRSVQVLIEFAATLLIAGLSWRYVEKPIIGWAARVTSSSPVDPARQLSDNAAR
jgi:peptidoglycan/LPS O-acetylase OafA/YrhL